MITFNWEFNLATLVLILANIVVVVSFAIRTQSKAASAEKIANQALLRAHEAHEKISIQVAAHSLFREQVAREYVDRDVLREMEERVMTALNRLSDKLDETMARRPRA